MRTDKRFWKIMHEYDATYIYFNTILINSGIVYPLPSSFVDCTKVCAFFNVFAKLSTYPSPNSTSNYFTLRAKCWVSGGVGGQVPEIKGKLIQQFSQAELFTTLYP